MEDIQITINGKVLEYYYNSIEKMLSGMLLHPEINKEFNHEKALNILTDLENTLKFELDNVRRLKQQVTDK